jgi:hypothetical protein
VSLPNHTPTRLSDIDWRWALPRLAVVFVATRLIILAVAIAAEATQTVPEGLLRIDDRPILASLTLWDGEFYTSIANDGYHADPSFGPDYAFYPGYPAVIWAMSLLTFGDLSVAAVLVSNVAFALALVALYSLSVRYLSPERSILTLWFLALSPGAIAFAMSYSDSLFLLFAVGIFVAAEARHWWLAGILLGAAAITRAPGVLLSLPLLVLLISWEGIRPTRSWLWLAIGPALLIGFWAWLWWLTGDPMAPASAQAYWDAPTAEGPVDTVGVAARGILIAPEMVITYWIGAIVFHAFLFVYFRHDRMPPTYWLVAIVLLASVFLSGSLQSAPRYLAVAWPFYWVLASRESRIGRSAVMGIFVVMQIVLLWLAFTWSVPP